MYSTVIFNGHFCSYCVYCVRVYCKSRKAEGQLVAASYCYCCCCWWWWW